MESNNNFSLIFVSAISILCSFIITLLVIEFSTPKIIEVEANAEEINTLKMENKILRAELKTGFTFIGKELYGCEVEGD